MADDPFLAEHEAVLAALAADRLDAARRALEHHLRSAEGKMLERLRRFRENAHAPKLPFIIPIRDTDTTSVRRSPDP